jgi:hypothetical protein
VDATLPSEGEPTWVQVWEIPPIVPTVTEHRGYRVRCPHCAALVPPPNLPEGAFGPRLTAMGSMLHGRFRLSMRETAGLLADLFGVPLGPGSVSALCQEMTTALDELYEDVRERVEAETHANVDETGWKQAGERRWLWVAVTALCTVFVVATNRSAAVLLPLLGETFDRVVSSDRYTDEIPCQAVGMRVALIGPEWLRHRSGGTRLPDAGPAIKSAAWTPSSLEKSGSGNGHLLQRWQIDLPPNGHNGRTMQARSQGPGGRADGG